MTRQHVRTAATATTTFLSVAWSLFVVVFLYYVVLTLVAISVEQPSDTGMIAAYLLPVAAYGLLLLSRAARALASTPVEIGQLALPRLR